MQQGWCRRGGAGGPGLQGQCRRPGAAGWCRRASAAGPVQHGWRRRPGAAGLAQQGWCRRAGAAGLGSGAGAGGLAAALSSTQLGRRGRISSQVVLPMGPLLPSHLVHSHVHLLPIAWMVIAHGALDDFRGQVTGCPTDLCRRVTVRTGQQRALRRGRPKTQWRHKGSGAGPGAGLALANFRAEGRGRVHTGPRATVGPLVILHILAWSSGSGNPAELAQRSPGKRTQPEEAPGPSNGRTFILGEVGGYTRHLWSWEN